MIPSGLFGGVNVTIIAPVPTPVFKDIRKAPVDTALTVPASAGHGGAQEGQAI